VILISGPQWAQQVGGAATDPFMGDNLAYVGHIYPISAASLLADTSPIAQAAAVRPVFITEWGYHDTGNAVWGGTEAGFGEPLKTFVESHGLS
jgi:hypothetical protein